MSARTKARPTFSARATARYQQLHDMDPHQAAGLVQLRVAQDTGTLVGLYQAQDAGMESDAEAGAWMTVCEDHGSCVLHPTVALGKAHAAAPQGWCQECRGDDQ